MHSGVDGAACRAEDALKGLLRSPPNRSSGNGNETVVGAGTGNAWPPTVRVGPCPAFRMAPVPKPYAAVLADARVARQSMGKGRHEWHSSRRAMALGNDHISGWS